MKKFLVLSFDQNDISTYGLTFGISNETGKRTHFSSVIIEKNTQPAIIKDFAVRPTYNVLHFKNFDPNTQEYQVYAQDVDKIELPGLLMELSKHYFDQLGRAVPKKESPKNANVDILKEVYQCSSCLTVYDETYGDAKSHVAVGTPFMDVAEDYVCPVCSAPKSGFEKMKLQIL